MIRSQAPASGPRPSLRGADRSPEPPDGGPSLLPKGQPASIRERLQRGRPVADRVFDDIYPLRVRRASRVHWTPVETAVRAARLLADGPSARVLDVGSGVGKFCIVAAAAVGARVSGVEHRTHLVEVAELTAARVGVDVTFVRGTLADCDPHDFDGIYLFNPFAENLCSLNDQIDGTVELSEARFVRDVAATRDFLRAARAGTRVVTYCGFGGDLPPGYTRVLREHSAGPLSLWVKTSAQRTRVGAGLVSSSMVDSRETRATTKG